MKSTLRQRALMASAVSLVLGAVSFGVGTGASGGSTPTPGVTSTSVTIGATVPQTGPAMAYYEVSSAANAVFNYINNVKGGINGRKIDFIRLNDCYNLAPLLGGCGNLTSSQTTYTQTQQLVVTDHVFATVGSLGTAAQDSVRNYLKAEGVPQLFVNSGASDWNNPTKYPDLFGFQASYETEGQVFAKDILANYKRDKIGFIGQNDGFGQEGYAGLTKGTGVKITGGENLYQWTDTGSAAELGTYIGDLKTDQCKVVVLDSIPPITEALLNDAHNDGFKPTWIISSVGSDPISVNSALENASISTNAFPATNSTSNKWNQLIRTILLTDKADFPSFTSSTMLDGNMQYGATWAFAFAEALRGLGANVTRAGIVAAMSATKFALPTITPLSYSSKNHQGLECAMVVTIKSGGTRPTEYVSDPSTKVECSSGLTPVKITAGKYAVATIPSWL